MTLNEKKNWIQSLLDRNNRAVERAVLAIYARQTESEKASHNTLHDNGVGFSGFDAEILTNFAQWILRGYPLTPNQTVVARKKMKRYWKQLAAIAESKGNLPKAPSKMENEDIKMSNEFSKHEAQQEAKAYAYMAQHDLSLTLM